MSGNQFTPKSIVNLVFFIMLFNIIVLTLVFGVLAGVARLSNSVPGSLALLFSSASGILAVLSTLLGVLRTAITSLLDSLANTPQTASRAPEASEDREPTD